MIKSIYRIYYSILCSLFICFCFSSYIMIGEMDTMRIIICLAGTAMFCLLELAPVSVRFSIPGIFLVGITGIALLGTGSQKQWLKGYFEALFFNQSPSADYIFSYELVQAFLVTILACLFVILIDRIKYLKYITAVCLIGFLLYGLFTRKGFEPVGIVAAITLIISIWIEWIQSRWNKRRSDDYAGYLVWLLPFILAFSIILYILPYSDSPYGWDHAKNAYNKLSEKFTILSETIFQGNREDFDNVMTGFSSASSFFGNVKENNDVIMRIEGNNMLVTNLYLIGRSYDSFNGRGWDQFKEETSRDRAIDTMETLYAVKCYDKEHTLSYISPATITVKYNDYRSQYRFIPLKASKFTVNNRSMNLFEEDNFLVGKKNGFGYEYTVNFYQLNIDHAVFYEMLEGAYEDSESYWQNVKISFSRSPFNLDDKAAYDYALINQYSEEIELSDDMKAWVEEKTAGAGSPVQRIKMLELALSEMEYTKTPGDLPPSVVDATSFLDYFILDSKKGYCTYFATAMTLLARSEGFPARYVEGFCVPIKNKKANVTNSMAHAWPEIYFEGIGWVPFEPTPGYDIFRYTPWEIETDEAKEGNQVNARYWEVKENKEPAKMQELPDPEPEKKSISLKKILSFVKGLGIIIACIAVIILIEKTVMYYHYKKLTLEQKYLLHFNRNMKILAFFGLSLQQGETLAELATRFNEYKQRWDCSVSNDSDNEYHFMSEYEAYRYGGTEITVSMLEDIRREQERLLKHIKYRIGNFYIKAE